MNVVITTMVDKYFIFMLLLVSCPGIWAGCSQQATLDKTTNVVKFEQLKQHIIKNNLSLSYDAKGLQPLFNLAKSFMDTVQAKNIGEEFKDEKLSIDGISKGDALQKLLKGYELPILICIGIGLLFILVMPIVGCCFCCCRCCNNCGGSMKQSEQNASKHCKVSIMVLFLFIFTVMMLCGVLFMFVTNNRLNNAFDSVVQKYDEAIDEAMTMADILIKDVDSLTSDQVPCIVDFLRTHITDVNLQKDIGIPLQTQISGNVSSALALGLASSKSIDKLFITLSGIVNLTDDLKADGGRLQTKINTTRNNLTGIVTDCKNINGTNPICTELENIKLNVKIDFNVLPNIKTHLDDMQTVKNLNLTKNINKAKQMVDDIPKIVVDKSKVALDGVRKILTDIEANIQTQGNNATKFMRETVDKAKKSATDFNIYKNLKDKTYDQFERIRWKVYVGLSALMAFIVFILFCGLFCGSCGYQKDYMPTERTTTSNCGGNFLMASVGLMFIFSFILMIFCVIWFTVGIHVHIVCREMKNGEFIDNMVFKQIKNKDFNDIKLEDILVNCRSNKAIYQASSILEKKYNVTAKLNVNIMKDVNAKINEIVFNFDDKKVLNKDAEDALDRLNNSTASSINYTKFFTELKKTITGQNLNEIVTNLTKLANLTKTFSPSLSTRIMKLGQEIKEIEDNIVVPIKPKITLLENDVKKLQTEFPAMKDQGNDLLMKLKECEYFMKNINITSYVATFALKLAGWVDQGIHHIKEQVTHQLGRCKPIANIYDGLVNTYFCDNLVQNANGFWLALGWCLLFFVPSIILSVKLAKYFRKMEYTSGMDTIVVDNPPYNDKMPVHEIRAPPPYTSTQHSNPGYQHM